MIDYKRHLELIENAIHGIPYPDSPPELYEPIRYTMTGSGKRLRPLLSLMACELFGGNIEEAVHPALSLELLHNFTLIHDDIMDQAPLRRGRETVYRKWNSNIAILAGDTMYAMAYDYLSQTRPDILPQVLHTFNRIAIQVCEGQQYDMNFEHQGDVNIDAYIEMIRLKTAVFFGGCMQIGALLGGARQDQATHLYHYGESLGIAFQLQDDILDVFGTEMTFGKKPGGDIVANKKTYLYMKALELAGTENSARLRRLYNTQPPDPAIKLEEVVQIFTRLHVRNYAEVIMDHYYQAALEHLALVEVNPSFKDSFRDFGISLFKRNK